jgi:F0F1-type ATP synthase assembly protein I
MLNQIDYQVMAMMDRFAQSIPVIIVAIIVLLLTGLLAGFAVKIADRITGKS